MIAAQPFDTEKVAKTFKENIDKLPPKFKEIFAVFVLSDKYNSQSFKIKEVLNSAESLYYR